MERPGRNPTDQRNQKQVIVGIQRVESYFTPARHIKIDTTNLTGKLNKALA